MSQSALSHNFIDPLDPPHGGVLNEPQVPAAGALALKQSSATLPGNLNACQLRDLELLLIDTFSRLKGFLNRRDYQSVLDDLRLADGRLWPIPIMLDVDDTFASKPVVGNEIALRGNEGVPLAVLNVEDLCFIDPQLQSRQVLGTTDGLRSGVAELHGRRASPPSSRAFEPHPGTAAWSPRCATAD